MNVYSFYSNTFLSRPYLLYLILKYFFAILYITYLSVIEVRLEKYFYFSLPTPPFFLRYFSVPSYKNLTVVYFSFVMFTITHILFY